MPKNEKLETKRHSLAHIMAASILEMFPEARLGVGPVVEDGFYYDVHLNRPPDLKTRGTTAVADLDAPNRVGGNVNQVSVYKTGTFIDLCRGPHVGATSEIDPA